MDSHFIINAGLLCIILIIFFAPFIRKEIEHNLEIFLCFCGIIALIISGWNWTVVQNALIAPFKITVLYGIPIGIVQVVLIFGFIFYFWHERIHSGIIRITRSISLDAMIFSSIIVLGLISSIISAILATIIFLEIVHTLPVHRKSQVAITVTGCFAIGFGAVLTPLGEPLSTIAVEVLSGPPYYADFSFLFELLGLYILPGILAIGILGLFLNRKLMKDAGEQQYVVAKETMAGIFIRAGKIFVFIFGLILLGAAIEPFISVYIVNISTVSLYWMNIISAVLDNATLTAIEIDPLMTVLQIQSALLALLAAGGMLIPGNIPNIIAAGKFNIKTREWAEFGIPIGVAALGIYFLFIFIPVYLIS
ncbi:MAG: DUF1646 domain-containing protein [Methanoregulaceae archaeon]|nr:DUF1646 domain-containing protein [Methanoregulaceae archaeon]MCU0628638.1 DUF1646 domain-containing protein [Methanoregulaceae archaeon]